MPLQLGATPAQVFIDGVPQLSSPFVVSKPALQDIPPACTSCDAPACEAVLTNGDPDRSPKSIVKDVVFTNVQSAFAISSESGLVEQLFGSSGDFAPASPLGIVVVRSGSIACAGDCQVPADAAAGDVKIVDLRGGSILPSLVSYGAPLGVSDIPSEPSTQDGEIFDVLSSDVPRPLDGAVIKGSEALSFGGKDLLCAVSL